MTLEVMFAALLHETTSSLSALAELRYVSLRYVGYVAEAEQAEVQGAFPALEDLFSLWFVRIPSLEHLELDIELREWKRTWWRRQPLNDRPGENPYGTRHRIIRVSEEEGLS
ncbi:hypothetical protein CERSUDRAFT_113041 [Gelatoporia subvermispora B]|uniref:Uncharacterized protein n=1 Tax=Ceriporiopsis subvermispora (strain B) TaxID=914234 RepID=M2RKU4_CERS8|nr:hypothetical protein CERSUDRAFT_113041 [Gelatoporia subvermispora B]